AEMDGSVTGSDRRIQALKVAAIPPGDALPDWRIFQKLAGALGTEWSYADTRALQEELRRHVPLYQGLGRRVGPAAAGWRRSAAVRSSSRCGSRRTVWPRRAWRSCRIISRAPKPTV